MNRRRGNLSVSAQGERPGSDSANRRRSTASHPSPGTAPGSSPTLHLGRIRHGLNEMGDMASTAFDSLPLIERLDDSPGEYEQGVH